jgi:hypothetical protein
MGDIPSLGSIILHWILRVLTDGAIGLATTALCYFCLWILGKSIEPAKRKYFFVVGLLVFGTLAHALISGTRYLHAHFKPPPQPSATRGSVFLCSLSQTTSMGEGFSVLFNLRLTNPGKATTAWHWRLGVTLLGGQYYQFNAIEAPNLTGTFWDPSGSKDNPDVRVTNDNYLPTMLLRDTVSPDRGAHGYVIFWIRNIPRKEIKPGTKFTIEFEQSDGSKRTIEHTWEEPRGP